MIELTDTNSSEIAAAMVRDRIRAGSPVMGMVLTLIVVVDDEGADAAMSCARAASREHPSRVLGVILGDGRGAPQVHAQLGIGSGATGEEAVIRLRGKVVKHADSVVLPLLLPDSPVAIWWPGNPPDDPANDPLGSLAQRRITDSAAATTRKRSALHRVCSTYAPGNTDLAWTRLTPWRALLAATLDQYELRVTAGSVTSERISPSADLMVTWLGDRLKAPIERGVSDGPGITEIVLETARGPIRVTRLDGKLATISSPDRPDRPIALKRMAVPALLAEELRRLDEDDVFAEVARSYAKRGRSDAKRGQP